MSERFNRADYPDLYEECLEKDIIENYKAGSHRKIKWQCSKCGNVWKTELRVRAVLGCGCPACNGGGPSGKPHKPADGQSLVELYPDIALMWDEDQNDITPFDVSAGSEYVAHWICENGHRFARSISEQVAKQHKCPECSRGLSSSFGEQFIYHACLAVFEGQDVFNRNSSILGFEVDILIPKQKIGFEYGSWYWHKDRISADIKKIQKAKESGFTIYCVYDGMGDDISKAQSLEHAYCICEKSSSDDYVGLQDYLDSIIVRDGKSYNAASIASKAKQAMHEKCVPKEKSFEYKYPAACDEWDWERNGDITPDKVYALSEQKYWFICPEGHSYEATPMHKTERGDGCPVCRGFDIRSGINSFAALHPNLMKYWDWERNSENPDEISQTCSKKIKWYWRCPDCKSEWDTSCSQTVINNSYEEQCPACRQRNSLMTVLDAVKFGLHPSVYVSERLFPRGRITWREYLKSLESYVKTVIEQNQYYVTGNHKFWIVETDNIYVRITKEPNHTTIRDCYILDIPLGEKTLLDDLGKAIFENVKPIDDSFGAQHLDVMLYWDWAKNECNPFDISDNIQSQKVWYWKCPECGEEWNTTRPIKDGGNASYFCRNCYIREKLANLIDTEKIHFYDVHADNDNRNIVPNSQLMSLISSVALQNLGRVEMDAKLIYIQNGSVKVAIKKNNGIIAFVSGIVCVEAKGTTELDFNLLDGSVNKRRPRTS